MTANQKLLFSRELRQWIGIAAGAIGTAYMLNPEGTSKALGNVGKKIKNIGEKVKGRRNQNEV